MFTIDDYSWLDSPESQMHWQSISRDPSVPASAILKRLRQSLTIPQASLLLEQYELLTASRKKVANPGDWFWTRQLLEQSSDEETASETALDFPAGASVNDICCGAGADSIAMAKRGLHVHASDRSSIACYLTRRNALSQKLKMEVTEESAEQCEIDQSGYVHIDPDRRSDGRRFSNLESLSPAWQTLCKISENCLGMSLKLAPGTRLDSSTKKDQLNRPPESIRFLSKEGSVRQQRWYWGIDRWPRNSITLSLYLNEPAFQRAVLFHSKKLETNNNDHVKHRGWFHESFLESEWQVKRASDSVVVNSLHRYIADYDPSVRAAEISPQFASRYGWQLLSSDSGYITSNDRMVHPMVRWFEVVENLPLDRKQLKAFAKSVKTRTWELKSRGIDLDLDAVRKVLPTDRSSTTQTTILFTKICEQHRAIVCKEVDCSTEA